MINQEIEIVGFNGTPTDKVGNSLLLPDVDWDNFQKSLGEYLEKYNI